MQSSPVTLLLLFVFPVHLLAQEEASDGAQESLTAKPNIVFILVDDLGKMDMGCEGSTFHETPYIDELAARSVRFTNGYSACQVCSPSRAAIQTGKNPPRVRITDYISPAGNNQPEKWKRNTRLLPASFNLNLDLEETTIAEALKELGYHTYFAGKWHLGNEGHWPEDQGYDINVGGHQAGTPPGGYFAPYKNPRLTDGEPGEHLPIRLGEETAAYIQSQAQEEQPFFAMLSFYSVHGPIQTTEVLWRKYQAKAEKMGLVVPRDRFLFDRTQEVRQVQDNPLYAGMMEALDTSIGMVLRAIEESGQADNTVVIFTSDNGGVSSGDGYATSALPLRGGKGRQWEGGIRQPYYVYVPGIAAHTTEAFATGVDFFPTIVELAGGTCDDEIDGVSLVPALRQQDQLTERTLCWHYPHYGNQGGEPSGIIRQGDWKLIHYYEDGRNELYNLSWDPGEHVDTASQHPQRVADMLVDLEEWLEANECSMPMENPNFDSQKYSSSLLESAEQRMQRREESHWSFLQPDYSPKGGWWEQREKK